MTSWGHYTFLLITFDWIELETWKRRQSVALTQAHQIICNMTYLGHLVTFYNLDLWSNFEVDLSRSMYKYMFRFGSSRQIRWHHYHGCTFQNEIVIREKTISLKTYFFIWWPVEAKRMTLAQSRCHDGDFEFNCLSNAAFGFVLSIIVPEIMKVFRSDVRQSRKTRIFCNFLPLDTTILTLAKKWLK